MKIVVAGKGGAGKTTVSGTIARALARAGNPVLALDADGVRALGQKADVDVAPHPRDLCLGDVELFVDHLDDLTWDG